LTKRWPSRDSNLWSHLLVVALTAVGVLTLATRCGVEAVQTNQSHISHGTELYGVGGRDAAWPRRKGLFKVSVLVALKYCLRYRTSKTEDIFPLAFTLQSSYGTSFPCSANARVIRADRQYQERTNQGQPKTNGWLGKPNPASTPIGDPRRNLEGQMKRWQCW
jgi:hypothetical protein